MSNNNNLTEFLVFALFYARHDRWPAQEIGVDLWQEASRITAATLAHLGVPEETDR